MNVLDLFAGAAGGMSLGLHRAGFRTVAAVEIDEWRRACFARNFPHVKMYADVRDVSRRRLVRDGVWPIHVVAGSPPCQDASTANAKGKGVDGERTGLFFELVRLVAELRPAWVLAENVSGIRARGVDRILAALEAEGYAVWPLVVGAWHAGAPHRRNRVWIVANADGNRRQSGRTGCTESIGLDKGEIESHWPLPNAPPLPGSPLAGGEPDGDTAGAAADAEGNALRTRRVSGAGGKAPLAQVLDQWRHWNGGAPDLGRVDVRLPKGVARAALAAYGDSVVPQIVECIGKAIMRAEGLIR